MKQENIVSKFQQPRNTTLRISLGSEAQWYETIAILCFINFHKETHAFQQTSSTRDGAVRFFKIWYLTSKNGAVEQKHIFWTNFLRSRLPWEILRGRSRAFSSKPSQSWITLWPWQGVLASCAVEVVGPASGNSGFLHSVVHWPPFAAIYVDALNRKHKPCANHPMRWRCKRIALVISCHNSNPHACFSYVVTTFLLVAVIMFVSTRQSYCTCRTIPSHTSKYLIILAYLASPCITWRYNHIVSSWVGVGLFLSKPETPWILPGKNEVILLKLGNVYCFTVFLWFPMVSYGFSMFFLGCPTNFLFHQSIKSRTPSHLSPRIFGPTGWVHRPRFRDLTRDRLWPK